MQFLLTLMVRLNLSAIVYTKLSFERKKKRKKKLARALFFIYRKNYICILIKQKNLGEKGKKSYRNYNYF